jgi:Ni/Fe-hydrogenase subunit HybB-like protein
MFWLEVALLGIPMILVAFRRIRGNPQALFAASVMVVGGFLVNRLNVSLTGLEAAARARYMPSWMELAITMSIVTVGLIAFRYAAEYLPVFHSTKAKQVKEESPSAVYAQS